MSGLFGGQSVRTTVRVLAIGAMCWFGCVEAMAQSDGQLKPPALFKSRPAAENIAGPKPMAVIRSRAVDIEVPTLMSRSEGSRLSLNCFDDVELTLTIDSVRQTSVETVHIKGQIAGHALSHVQFVFHKGAVAGLIRVPGVGEFRVRSSRGVGQIVEQIDSDGFASCGTDAHHIIQAVGERQAVAGDGPVQCDEFIDVMVVYTPEARDLEGGTAAIEALAHLAIDETNAAFNNSQIFHAVRLVHVAEVNYVETGNFNTELDALRNPGDGLMDEVHALRDQYGADMVDLLISHTQQGTICGIAYLMSPVDPGFEADCFSVCNTGCVLGGYTFEHELGHNFGCHHDRDNASGMPAFDFSYGHRFNASNNIQYRTIMSYAPGNRIPYFSNPEVLYLNTPTGVPAGTTDPKGLPISADNAQTINLTADTVKDFRTLSPLGPDPGPLSWPAPTVLTPTELAAGDRFGVSVAMDGDLAIVGAYQSDDPTLGVNVGAAYIFRYIEGTGWMQEARLTASDALPGDLFGISVDITKRDDDNAVAVIGAYQTDQGAKGAGSVYVFRGFGSIWVQEHKLVAAVPNIHDSFGYSCAVASLPTHDLVLVGAYNDDETFFNSGAAYVFSNQTGFWEQQAKLKAADPGSQDNFGISVALAIQPDTLHPFALIGSYRDDDEMNFKFDTGAAYAFTVQEGVWTQLDKIRAVTRQSADQFGFAVDLEATSTNELVALVGAWGVDGAEFNAGAAYVLRKNLASATGWVQEAKLTAGDPGANDRLGNAVSLSGDIALVGAYLHDEDPVNAPDTGAAYVFRKRGLGWSREARIRASDPAPDDEFGFSLAVDGPRAIFGAWQRKIDDNNPLAGAMYTTDATAIPDCNANDLPDECDIALGISQDANGNGVPDECEIPPCPPDIAPAGGDGVVNVNDLLAVINGWGACADPCPPSCAADVAPAGGDCVVNVNDLLAIINGWGPCPQ